MFPIENVVALVTGSNRGLGRALVAELLSRGAKKVYAASRSGELEPSLAGDPRVVPLRLDVTDPAQVQAATEVASDLNVLINNAGLFVSHGLLTTDPVEIRRDMDTNFLAVVDVTRRFVPALVRNTPATIVNVLSVVSLAAMPALGGYSASKAAAWSSTQALRGELAARDVRVMAVFPGPIDTEMLRGMEMPKTAPAEVARAIVDGLVNGEADVFPDPMSREIGQLWRTDPGAVERRFAG